MSETLGEVHSHNSQTRVDQLKETFGSLRKTYYELESSLVEARNIAVPEEVMNAYDENRDQLIDIYGNNHLNPNLLYHGTGAIQYAGDKYKSGVSTEFRYPLDSILKEGLKPHHDMWVKAKQGGVTSTSFATSWPYAKWYADKHQDPDNPLLWNFGDSSEWFQYYMMDTMRRAARDIALHPTRSLRHYAPAVITRIGETLRNVRHDRSGDPEELTKLQQWVSDVRKDITPATPILDVLRGATDIHDNFGVVITINTDDVELFDMGSGGIYEVRTESEVVPGRFKSVAVPLHKVPEYKEKIRSLGLAIPVLPTEAVEYHFSHFPFNEVTTDRRVK